MDLFDDILLEVPPAPARPSAKFAPKVKSKQSLRKEISASEHATSSVDGKNMHVASTPTVTKSIRDTNLDNESELNKVPSPSTAFLDSNKSLQVNNSLQDSLNVGFKSSSGDNSTAISENNIHSIFTSGKVQEDANERKQSLRKRKRSYVAGVEDDRDKSSRQLRKQVACEHVKNSNSLIEDDDELDPPYICNNIDQIEENDDEDEVDNSSKKKRALTNSKKKYMSKNGKAYKKSKKENGDSEKTTKEPPKKFSRSSRRRKRQVDQALLDDYELGSRSISLRDILAISDDKERQEKKEAKSSTNQSGGDFFHDAGANNEEETFSSDDDGLRDQEDDQASKKFASTVPLYNSHSFRDKSPRVKWSKQDTEKFYEALKEFGLDFTMIQQIFASKTRRQIKLKFKNEDQHHPLRITDAINSHSSDHHIFKSVIAKLPQISTTNANQEATEDTTEDMSPGINEQVATTEQDSADVKDQEDPMAYQSPEQFDDSDDDLWKWSQYQSVI
ncbi:transcription factor TFIIIB component B'' isoform X2 [Medicago truncatula]|uniref:transcription factor TFIIIB component B'' isoform X2 n=1 Tax=Medicago truncatula TaxID=3880 RepID=UPI0019686343|nr:transcription factor TFIIIB component B'' isoform X2 [Medicago truncatula]